MNQTKDRELEKIDRIKINTKMERSETERKFLEKVNKIYPNCVVCKEKSEKFSSPKQNDDWTWSRFFILLIGIPPDCDL